MKTSQGLFSIYHLKFDRRWCKFLHPNYNTVDIAFKAAAKRSQYFNTTLLAQDVGHVKLALAAQFRHACWVLLAQIWPFSNLSWQHPTCYNTSQQGGQTCTTCFAQQCCNTLHWNVAIVWLGFEESENVFDKYSYVDETSKQEFLRESKLLFEIYTVLHIYWMSTLDNRKFNDLFVTCSRLDSNN